MYEVLNREMICPHMPTAMCHASSVLPLPNGQVLVAWFGGSHEGEPDTDIWLSRRAAGTGSPTACGEWSAPRPLSALCSVSAGFGGSGASAPGTVLAPVLAAAHWNPVLRRTLGGDLVLYYKVGQQIATWRTYGVTSTDGGLSWSAPVELVPGDMGGRGPVRNKVIRLADGRLLAPASREGSEWTAFVDISDDDGQTWRPGSCVRMAVETYFSQGAAVASRDIPVSEQSFQGRGIIQPSLWEDARGVHMLLRSTEGAIFRSDSQDRGENWSVATPTALPNNNSGLDVTRLDSGALVLACNPVAGNWGVRTPLSLLLSTDSGASWSKLLDMESGHGEFAYPAIVAEGTTLHVTYTWKRMTIAYWRIVCNA